MPKIITQLSDEMKEVLMKSDMGDFREAMRALKESAELEDEESSPRYVAGEDYTVTEDVSQRTSPIVTESKEFEETDRDAIMEELVEGMEDEPSLQRLVKQALMRG